MVLRVDNILLWTKNWVKNSRTTTGCRSFKWIDMWMPRMKTDGKLPRSSTSDTTLIELLSPSDSMATLPDGIKYLPFYLGLRIACIQQTSTLPSFHSTLHWPSQSSPFRCHQGLSRYGFWTPSQTTGQDFQLWENKTRLYQPIFQRWALYFGR